MFLGLLEVFQGNFIFPLLLEGKAHEVVGLGQAWVYFEGPGEGCLSFVHAALANTNTANIDPTVCIAGVDFGHPFENLLCSSEVALQQESDAVVVPANKIG